MVINHLITDSKYLAKGNSLETWEVLLSMLNLWGVNKKQADFNKSWLLGDTPDMFI